jgi:hypothetical protein
MAISGMNLCNLITPITVPVFPLVSFHPSLEFALRLQYNTYGCAESNPNLNEI